MTKFDIVAAFDAACQELLQKDYRIAELEEALRPFAEEAGRVGAKPEDSRPLWAALGTSFAQRAQHGLVVGDLRRAAALLNPSPKA